jgi:hypothetical protein
MEKMIEHSLSREQVAILLSFCIVSYIKVHTLFLNLVVYNLSNKVKLKEICVGVFLCM